MNLNIRIYFAEENHIKFINGKTFYGLVKLIDVDLKLNRCIDQRFDHFKNIEKTVNEKCAFDDYFDFCQSNNEINARKISTLQQKLQKMEIRNEKLYNESFDSFNSFVHQGICMK